jgi:hypothetical protein
MTGIFLPPLPPFQYGLYEMQRYQRERPTYRHPYLPSATKFYLLNGSIVDPSTQKVFYLGNGQGLPGTYSVRRTEYYYLTGAGFRAVARNN